MARLHLFVSGRVQGVFFRQSAKAEAERLGLAGWVKNLADGRVEAVAEGSAEAARRFAEWCRRGPAMASVEDVEVYEEDEEGLDAFEIRRGK